MNNSKKGLNIEREIINHINEKKYISNMNLNIKKFIKEIFKSIKENDEIIAYKYISNYKPDIVIEVKKQKNN